MSFKAVDWAVRQRITCFPKMVLIMLADRHNSDTGRCDPSHDRLTEDCGMSRRAVITQIDNLVSLGLIKVVNRQKDGIKTTNSYILNLHVNISHDVQQMHIDVQQMHTPSAADAQGVVQEMHINPEVEPVIEPVKDNSKLLSKKRTGNRSKLPDGFMPNEIGLQRANEKGLNVKTELQKFCDYHTAEGSLKADWQATWRTWVGNAWAVANQQPRETFAERDERRARERMQEAMGTAAIQPVQGTVIDITDVRRIK